MTSDHIRTHVKTVLRKRKKMSHTPGPWIDWDTLEWLHDPMRLLTNTDDARLIAAAPELLEALKELCDRLGPRWFLEENWAKPLDALSKAGASQ